MYVGPVVVYKITDPKSCPFCTLDGKLLVAIFGHEALKPVVVRTSQRNVATLPQLKQVCIQVSRIINIL